ncbi:hypothetical protein D3Z36_10010 [Lachnospiraceae bacterium]|nr:hypothetical protein [Lachnospiraceae bacterium]
MAEYVLSICFNYYKRFAILKYGIESLLQNQDQRLQIVVYDDSEDRRMETFLSSIDDSRLKHVKTPAHVGMVRGMVECICAGDGIYSMYATEMEMFDYKKISAFMDNLQCHQNVGAGCSGVGCGNGYQIYKKGADAVRNVAIRFAHPTGFFFKTSEYRNIDYLKYSDTESYGNFPLDFLMGELLVKNDGMLHESVWYSGNDYIVSLSEEKSFTTVSEENAWFMPKGREKLLDNAIKFIEQLPLSFPEKSSLLLKQFEKCAEGVSSTLKGTLAKDSLCRHYYMKSRYLDYKQYSYNLFHAYRFFCRSIPAKYHIKFLDISALRIVKKYLIKEI